MAIFLAFVSGFLVGLFLFCSLAALAVPRRDRAAEMEAYIASIRPADPTIYRHRTLRERFDLDSNRDV